MALENTQTSVTVTGDGATRAIPVYFPVLAAEHLAVSGYKADNTPFTYVMGTNYTVALNPSASGGAATATVTLVTALATGWKLTVARTVPLVQLDVYDNQSGLQPKTVENRLDYLTMIAQQLDRELLARLEIPPGMSAAEVRQLLANNAATLAALQTQVNAKASAADLAAAIASLNMKANIESPVLTGAPKASTPATNDNSTRIATTAFVKSLKYAPLDSPEFVGTPKAPTPPVGDRTTKIANTEFVASAVAPKANKTDMDAAVAHIDQKTDTANANAANAVTMVNQAQAAAESAVQALIDETSARLAADNSLQQQVNAKADASALTSEVTARTNADSNLQTQIDSLNSTKAPKDVATQTANGLMSKEDKAKLDSGGMAYGTVTMFIGPAGNDATGNGTSGKPFATFAGAWNYVATNYKGFIARLVIYYQDGTYSHNIELPNGGALPQLRYLLIQSLGLTDGEPRATINLTASVRLSGAADYVTVAYLKLTMADSSSADILTTYESVTEHLSITDVWFKRGTAPGRGLYVNQTDYLTINGRIEFEGNFTQLIYIPSRTTGVFNFAAFNCRNGSSNSYVIYATFATIYWSGTAGLTPLYDNFTLYRFAAATIGARILLRSGWTLAGWANGANSVVDSTSVLTTVS